MLLWHVSDRRDRPGALRTRLLDVVFEGVEAGFVEHPVGFRLVVKQHDRIGHLLEHRVVRIIRADDQHLAAGGHALLMSATLGASARVHLTTDDGDVPDQDDAEDEDQVVENLEHFKDELTVPEFKKRLKTDVDNIRKSMESHADVELDFLELDTESADFHKDEVARMAMVTSLQSGMVGAADNLYQNMQNFMEDYQNQQDHIEDLTDQIRDKDLVIEQLKEEKQGFFSKLLEKIGLR